jgi:hypothetical protein
MTLSKTEITDKIEVLHNGVIQVRVCTEVLDGSALISRTYNRYSLQPGDSLENESDKVKSIAQVIWTPEVISTYQASLSTQTV